MDFTHIHHTNEEFLNEFYQTYSPVFILNTGRSGSGLLQAVFQNFPTIKAYHEAAPNLFLHSNFAFHHQNENELLKKMFEVARIELMLEAAVEKKIFLETNQCLVFYVHQIINLFPNAKFIHLTRHPGDFVRSAIRKGWHKNDSVWELGRIKMKNSDEWNKFNQIEKIGWVWSSTHQFIEDFKKEFPDNCLTIRLEDIVSSRTHFNELLSFINSGISITKKQHRNYFGTKKNELYIAPNEPPNMYKLSDYPKYNEWDRDKKESLKETTGRLAEIYNYKLE